MASKKVIKKSVAKKPASKKPVSKKPRSSNDELEGYARGFRDGMKQTPKPKNEIFREPLNQLSIRGQRAHYRGWSDGRSLYNRLVAGGLRDHDM